MQAAVDGFYEGVDALEGLVLSLGRYFRAVWDSKYAGADNAPGYDPPTVEQIAWANQLVNDVDAQADDVDSYCAFLREAAVCLSRELREGVTVLETMRRSIQV